MGRSVEREPTTIVPFAVGRCEATVLLIRGWK
jgi:hypothetical protein